MSTLSSLSDINTRYGDAWHAGEHLRLITTIGKNNNNIYSKENLSMTIDWDLIANNYVCTKSSKQCYSRMKEWYLRLFNENLMGKQSCDTSTELSQDASSSLLSLSRKMDQLIV